MTTINVKAAPGLRVPREDNGRKYITDAEAVAVTDSTYYLRRLADGDLVKVAAEPPAEAAQADGTQSRPSTKSKGA